MTKMVEFNFLFRVLTLVSFYGATFGYTPYTPETSGPTLKSNFTLTVPGVLDNGVFHIEFDLVFCRDTSINSGGCQNGITVCIQLLEKRSSLYKKVYQGDLSRCGPGDEFLAFVVKLPYNHYTIGADDNYKFVADSTFMAYMRRLGEKNSIYDPVYVELGDTAFENTNCIEIKATAEKPKKDSLYNLGGKVIAKFPHEEFITPITNHFQRGANLNITVLGSENCGMSLKIRGRDTLTCHPINVTVCESGSKVTDMVSKFCPLDIGNRFIAVIDKDGKAVPDVLAHDVIVERIRHEAGRVLYGKLRELVLNNFNGQIKQSSIPFLAYEREETKASHLVLECQAGELKYKYTTGVIVMFKSGVYSGSYYSQN